MKKTPWTPEEVTRLNGYQVSGVMHEFTCGSGERCEKSHDEQGGMLIATVDGWICPYCDYTQDWAHEFMADGSWVKIKEQKAAWLYAQDLDAEGNPIPHLTEEQAVQIAVTAYLNHEHDSDTEIMGRVQSAMKSALRAVGMQFKKEL